jgi:hypothetical protein
MRNVLIAAAVVALPLAGCMPTGPSPEVIASAKQEILACYRDAKTRVAAAKCHSGGRRPRRRSGRFGSEDLGSLLCSRGIWKSPFSV